MFSSVGAASLCWAVEQFKMSLLRSLVRGCLFFYKDVAPTELGLWLSFFLQRCRSYGAESAAKKHADWRPNADWYSEDPAV